MIEDCLLENQLHQKFYFRKLFPSTLREYCPTRELIIIIIIIILLLLITLFNFNKRCNSNRINQYRPYSLIPATRIQQGQHSVRKTQTGVFKTH